MVIQRIGLLQDPNQPVHSFSPQGAYLAFYSPLTCLGGVVRGVLKASNPRRIPAPSRPMQETERDGIRPGWSWREERDTGQVEEREGRWKRGKAGAPLASTCSAVSAPPPGPDSPHLCQQQKQQYSFRGTRAEGSLRDACKSARGKCASGGRGERR